MEKGARTVEGMTFHRCMRYVRLPGRMASCIVSYLDTEGLRHTVEVEAESLYEAAVLAMRTFKQHRCEPGSLSRLDVEIRSSVTHTVTPKKVREWLDGGAKTPKQAMIKQRLREF